MAAVRDRGRKGGRRLIERYLSELRRRLPFALGFRARAVAEAREHLREAAASSSEEEAVAAFGSVDVVAARLSSELAARAAARASWLVPLVVAAYVIPFYLVPENAFPPAPWLVKPEYLAWKQQVAATAFIAAGCCAAVGYVVGRVRPRAALVPVTAAIVALAVAASFASIVGVQWIDAVPGTPAAVVYGVIIPGQLALVAAAAFALVQARPRVS